MAVPGCVVLADGRCALGIHGSLSSQIRVFGACLYVNTCADLIGRIAVHYLLVALPDWTAAIGNTGLHAPGLP